MTDIFIPRRVCRGFVYLGTFEFFLPSCMVQEEFV